MIQELQDTVYNWSEQTFGEGRSPTAPLNHLLQGAKRNFYAII
jgi:hypothetical protein